MRLIDADALKEHKFVDTDDNYRIGWNDALDAVANCEPTVDAAPVIRCKDCKFFQINKFDDTYLDMMCTENYDGYGAYMSTRPDDFCSNAEMKEE